jgi:hypothetical protein
MARILQDATTLTITLRCSILSSEDMSMMSESEEIIIEGLRGRWVFQDRNWNQSTGRASLLFHKA